MDLRNSCASTPSPANTARYAQNPYHISKIELSSGNDGEEITTVVATPKSSPETLQKFSYINLEEIGSGAFGEVYKARVHNSNEIIAIKEMFVAKGTTSDELEIMRQIDHCNIVDLKYFFYTPLGMYQVYLHLVMEFMPSTLLDAIKGSQGTFPAVEIKVYTYQLFRALAYLHGRSICHRDVKPENILVDCQTKVLKICDLGSAKILDKNNSSTSYICTRFYRAPELLCESTCYSYKIDVWSAGCVVAEMFLGRPIFPGCTTSTQLLEICSVLGNPTKEEYLEMVQHKRCWLPKQFQKEVKAQPWRKVFGARYHPQAIELVSKLFNYKPSLRPDMLVVCTDPFLDELRITGTRMPSGREFPPLFNFTEQELRYYPTLASTLVPSHCRSSHTPTTATAPVL